MSEFCHPPQDTPGSSGTRCRTSAFGSVCSGPRSPGGCRGGAPRRCLPGCFLRSAAGEVEEGVMCSAAAKEPGRAPSALEGRNGGVEGFRARSPLHPPERSCAGGRACCLLGLNTFLRCLEEAPVEGHLHLRWDRLPWEMSSCPHRSPLAAWGAAELPTYAPCEEGLIWVSTLSLPRVSCPSASC